MERTKLNVTHRDPADLKPHPHIKRLPEPAGWENDGEFFIALVEDLREHGLRKPLLIDADGNILSLDDAARWRAARRLQFEEVPVAVAPADSVFAAIIASVLHRKHLSKSARAYLLYPLFAPAHVEAVSRQLERAKTGNRQTTLHAVQHGPKGVEELARNMGVSDRLFRYAAEVHRIFKEDAEYKENLEAAILSDDPEECVSLSRVVAGYAGRKATADKAKGDRGQLNLFSDVIEHGFNRIKYWKDLEDADRKKIWERVDKRAAKLGEDELEALAEFHSAMARRLKELRKAKETAQ